MFKRRKTRPEKIGKWVNSVLGQLEDKAVKQEVFINKIWNSIADNRLIGHTKPDQIKGQKLIVFVESAVWMNELTFLKKDITIRAQTEFSTHGITINDVVFVLGKIQ